MNEFLIPANANKGKLIAGIFRPIDLIIFLCGAFATLILIFLFQDLMGNVFIAIFTLLPVSICGMLIMPIPNHHNMLVFIQGAYTFYMERRQYIWRGWCQAYGDQHEQQENKQ